jgi:hypothetical protein
MAARCQDDKPASFQIECRRDLVLKFDPVQRARCVPPR